MERIEEKIAVFRELLSSVGNIYLTEYNTNYEVVSSNSPYMEMMPLFLMCDQKFLDGLSTVDENYNTESQIKYFSRPVIFTNSIGMTWMSDSEIKEGKIHRIYMLGPLFLDDYSVKNIENHINRLRPSVATKRRFMEIIKEFPIIDLNRYYEYGIMLHKCITGENISVKDFEYPDLRANISGDEVLRERYGNYTTENKFMRLIEEGNLQFEEEMQKYGAVRKVGRMASADYLRHSKNMVIIFSVLCARAAVKGGLSSEIAYELRDTYILMVEQAESLGKLTEINQSMLKDYVQRVHRIKILSGTLSPQIKSSCDYIGIHLGENPDIHFLASRLGYTDYYFSNKFKKETGLSVSDFINHKKIEAAKEMLSDQNLSIQDICDVLGYNSRSYFGKVFHRDVGMSPREYRETHEKQ